MVDTIITRHEVRREARATTFVKPSVVAAPAPPPSDPPRPHGKLDAADSDRIRRLAARLWPTPTSRRLSRDRGLRRLTEYLASFPGDTWQARWEAAGLNEKHRPVRDLGTSASIRTEYTQALEAMLALRIIQPSLVAFRSNTFKDYPAAFRLAQEDADLDQFFAAVDAVPDTTPPLPTVGSLRRLLRLDHARYPLAGSHAGGVPVLRQADTRRGDVGI